MNKLPHAENAYWTGLRTGMKLGARNEQDASYRAGRDAEICQVLRWLESIDMRYSSRPAFSILVGIISELKDNVHWKEWE